MFVCVAGHLLAACLQYGQVLVSAASRLISAAAASPLVSSHVSLPPAPPLDRCSHATTDSSQLFMGLACFDSKYLPRRLLSCLRRAGKERLPLSDSHTHTHLGTFSQYMNMHTCRPLPLWSVLTHTWAGLSQQLRSASDWLLKVNMNSKCRVTGSGFILKNRKMWLWLGLDSAVFCCLFVFLDQVENNSF